MYQHVVHRISFQHLEAMFEDCFGLRVGLHGTPHVKALMARPLPVDVQPNPGQDRGRRAGPRRRDPGPT